MSRANIVAMAPTPAGLLVGFQTRDGGMLVYLYEGSDAEAILAGADPAEFAGVRVSDAGMIALVSGIIE